MTTGLIRWNPEADIFRGRLDRVFNQMLNDVWGRSVEGEGAGSFLPAVDIRETANALTFSAELPGLKKEEVQITLENQVLTISGERRLEKDEKNETFHRVERTYGTFSRSFTLPGNVKTGEATAKFDNGVLTIMVPKADVPKPHKIDIK
jgi:HSP20 family protein